METKVRGKSMIGKVIVSEESGRKFGVVGDEYLSQNLEN